jgi:hypothetical protein
VGEFDWELSRSFLKAFRSVGSSSLSQNAWQVVRQRLEELPDFQSFSHLFKLPLTVSIFLSPTQAPFSPPNYHLNLATKV